MKYVYTLVVDFHPELGDPALYFEMLDSFIKKTSDPDTENVLSFDYSPVEDNSN